MDATAVTVTGADRRTYLDDVSTQALRGLLTGEVRAALVLDQHGAPQAAFLVLAGEDDDTMVVPAGAVEHVTQVLARRTFLADARFAVRSGDVVWALRGDDGDDLLAASGTSLDEGRCAVVDGVLVARHAHGVELVGSADAVAGLVGRLADLGAEVVDAATLDAARVALGEPVFGREIVPPHLPEEMGLLATHVHLAKGCYPGQEAVARMWMLGRPRRRLAQVLVPADLPAGSELGDGRRRVRVTAVAPDGHALAYVPADVAPGDRLGDGATTIEVLGLVGDGREPPGADPAVTRRRDRPAAGDR